MGQEIQKDTLCWVFIRVREIMEKDSRKDPETDPNAVLAKVLVDQVRHLYMF